MSNIWSCRLNKVLKPFSLKLVLFALAQLQVGLEL